MIRLRSSGPARPAGAAGSLAAILVVVTTGYFVVSATPDRAGLADSVSLMSAVGTGRPPAPVIHQAPPDQTFSATARLTYTDAARHVTFHCYLNSPPASKCGPKGITYHLPIGGLWCFYVYATNTAGRASPRAHQCWAVLYRNPPFPHRRRHRHREPQPGPQNFSVGGSLTAPLYPGVSEPLDMTFTNPNPEPITIAAGAITSANITIIPSLAGCAAANFEVFQRLAVSITIPADATAPVSLLSLGVPQTDWPVITMMNTDTNQDACEGATLTLRYSGIEATG